jgi:hypothetical protein
MKELTQSAELVFADEAARHTGRSHLSTQCRKCRGKGRISVELRLGLPIKTS